MRVNCEPAKIDHSKVKVESRKNEGLHIVEIEVHSMGIIFPALVYVDECLLRPIVISWIG